MNTSIASHEYGSTSENNLLTPELTRYYNTVLTKPDIDILMELLNSPQTQHKVLAANLHTSTNSLSNRFSRLENIEPTLIITERIGRTKYYSLSEIAQAFMKQQFSSKSDRIRVFTAIPQDDALLSDTLKILERFQRVAGEGWDEIMDDILSGKIVLNENDEKSSEMKALYEDFIANLKELHILGKTVYIQNVYNALNQNVLIRRLKKLINNELNGYHALEPLFKLGQQNFEKAYILIDYAFSQIDPVAFKLSGSMESIQNLMLSSDQLNSIVCAILKMLNELRELNGNVTLAVSHWKEAYLSNNSTILYRIADKCYTIYYSESKQK